MLVLVLTQATPPSNGHTVAAAGHEHTPLVHVPHRQVALQAPQSSVLVVRSLQWPEMEEMAGQKVCPCGHWQAPLTQVPS
jgi:hypothetical protein